MEAAQLGAVELVGGVAAVVLSVALELLVDATPPVGAVEGALGTKPFNKSKKIQGGPKVTPRLIFLG